MTTTLRPAGPEERDAAGGRARLYDIRVNSRAVGLLRLAADATGGTGRILRLEVDGPERRRGRATVAALAAEEVLRSWGCRHIQADIPATAGAALALASALGYTESARTLVKGLTQPVPAPPPGTAVRAVTEEEYLGWLAQQGPGFLPDAVPGAAAGALGTLPPGPGGTRPALRMLAREGTDVGSLWLGLGGARLGHGTGGHVVSVAVRPRDQRRGYGRTLMHEAERICRQAGVRRLGLKVSPANDPALRLYASLGYRISGIRLGKPLL
ncbi:GNAT family N-acetyltransferase [Streptomyces sp. 7-21]|uniref:GNAT family N-acetyltransferase n=1 Tax=Streptomyces sp. 7-21 TaxID=2802283 RepID=UPI00191D9422|nr:GNAT family N-acetyltransferase [Streptomyces sp. 7-21]MBL1067315.1 GNAT family N-acetyltransferase [Streptomyces sp. 7-21]